MTTPINLGAYANDVRLVEHDARHATFYGRRCNPAISVVATHDGWTVVDHDRSTGTLLITATHPTAAAALPTVIGPPMLPDATPTAPQEDQ